MNKFLKKNFLLKENIITLEIQDQVTKKVTDFYKESPFPNYKNDDNKSTILAKGNKNILASQFKKFIGYNKNVYKLVVVLDKFQTIFQLEQIIMLLD